MGDESAIESGSVSGDLDYGALASRAWSAFTRKPVELIVGMLIATVTGFLLITAGAAWLGMSQQALDAVRGREVTIGTALQGYQNFVTSLVAMLLVGLAILVGGVLCVVPGLAALFFFSWTFFCMADDPSLGAVDAMKRSFALAKSAPVPTLAALGASVVLNLAGGAVMVGFLVTTPLALVFGAAVYDALTAKRG